jgi:hypothetical protein
MTLYLAVYHWCWPLQVAPRCSPTGNRKVMVQLTAHQTPVQTGCAEDRTAREFETFTGCLPGAACSDQYVGASDHQLL